MTPGLRQPLAWHTLARGYDLGFEERDKSKTSRSDEKHHQPYDSGQARYSLQRVLSFVKRPRHGSICVRLGLTRTELGSAPAGSAEGACKHGEISKISILVFFEERSEKHHSTFRGLLSSPCSLARSNPNAVTLQSWLTFCLAAAHPSANHSFFFMPHAPQLTRFALLFFRRLL